jgi:type VI secretion system protein ImpF
MPRYDNEVRITLSVLDRLLDFEPGVPAEPPASRAKNLRVFRQGIRRDLEWLLNTRRLAQKVPEGMTELDRSLASYGLPDFTTASSDSQHDQWLMQQAIEETVRTFETRLQDVVVTVEPARGSERAMRFRIDAMLVVDPAPEPVTFDTTLQLVSGEYQVQEK